MRILFTGASSFTGYWFVKELARAGHQVTACFRSGPDIYEGVRKQRIDQLLCCCETVFGCPFGSSLFVDTVKQKGPWDLFCHHAANVTNYRSQDFDIASAISDNTQNISLVLDALASQGCRKVVVTGSVFEQNEGAGPDRWRAFSPYGLSKGFTADIIRYHCALKGMKLGKFVIPNPFGPYEEPRFTAYLVRQWTEGKTAVVNTPAYVRDNIHVSLLAKAYCYFIEGMRNGDQEEERFNPSGYIESQGDFTLRFAREMRPRLRLPCEVELNVQTDFPEPKMRVNISNAAALPLSWNETAAWDDLAVYYQQIYNIHCAGAHA